MASVNIAPKGARGIPVRISKKKPETGNKGWTTQQWLAFSLLAGLSLLVYWNSISGGFVFDDSSLVQTDDRLQKIENIPRMLNPFSPAYLTYRPIRSISYAIDYYFSQYNPAGYHISNILYHVFCTWLVFLIALSLLPDWKPALAAAAFFAVHPVHTEAVSYISGRRDVLSTLFFLLGFYWFIRFRAERKPALMVGVFLAYGLGVLSKEMAVTLPAILLLYDWYGKSRAAAQDGQPASWRQLAGALGQALREHRLLYGSVVALGLFFVYYYLFVTPASTNLRIYWGGSAYTTFLTTGKIFAKYLQLVFFPVTLIADYNSGQVFPLATTLFDPVVMASLAIVLLALAGSLWAFKHFPPAGFGALFFFITLLPVAHIIPHHELMSEHYLYLPSMGVCLSAAWLLQRVAERRPIGRWAYAGALIIVALFSWRTIVRNRDWQDEYTLWTATLRDASQSVRAHTNLGLVYLARNDLDKAIEHFEKSLAIPSKVELGNISRGRALQNLGVAYMRKVDYPRALECFQKCLELDPRNYVSYINMGVVHSRQGKNLEAIEDYTRGLTIFPASKEALLNRAIGYTRVKDYQAAFRDYERLIELDRGTDYTARAHYNMGIVYYYYIKDYEKAAFHFEEARRMDPVKYNTEKWLGKPVQVEKIETPPAKQHQR